MKLYEVGCIVKDVQPKNGEKISLEEAQALEQVVNQYDGLKRFFTNELNKKEEGKE